MENEKRLIWDEDAKRHLIALAVGHHSETLHIDMILNAILHHTPTVDAVPVVHGHWHIDEYDSGEPNGYAAFIEVHCSKCSYELGAESGQYGWAYGDPFPLNYCPNCGAKMDGDGNE